METIELRIREHETNCREDYRGMVDSRCKLTGIEIAEIADLSQLARWYTNNVLGENLKVEFFQKLDAVKTQLSREEIIALLASVKKLDSHSFVTFIFSIQCFI